MKQISIVICCILFSQVATAQNHPRIYITNGAKSEFLERVKKTQAEILDKYASMVKEGGKMVYATCSILPSENELQVKAFLKKHPEFTFVKDQKVSPVKSGFDGFYMALLERSS